MTRSGLRPIHPGGFLHETLTELDVSQAQFARAIGVSPLRVSHVVNGKRPVTAALPLMHEFGRTSASRMLVDELHHKSGNGDVPFVTGRRADLVGDLADSV